MKFDDLERGMTIWVGCELYTLIEYTDDDECWKMEKMVDIHEIRYLYSNYARSIELFDIDAMVADR